jgi:hypothetical protein
VLDILLFFFQVLLPLSRHLVPQSKLDGLIHG